MGAQVEGLNVNGDIIASLNDKYFFVASSPYYVEFDDKFHEGQKKRKLLVPVQLSDGARMDYYPNKASIKMMAAQYGIRDMDKWVSHKFVWGIADQNVAGTMRKILYVLAEKFNDILPLELGGQ